MGNGSPQDAGSSPQRANEGGRDGAGVPDALLAAFAHEMRNALGPVRTATYLLRASTTDAQAQWALDLIDRQVQAITASIDELADLARFARGPLELDSQPMAFGDVLDGAASACATALSERRQTLEWSRPATAVAVHGDPQRLTQALSAVLRATSRAAQAGSPIRIAVERDATAVTTAIGGTAEAPIELTSQPEDDLGQSRVQPSANVGLTLAQEILARHGGSLTATGRSRFAIRLPVAS
jgi:signal transduction histidine kinase